MVGPPPPPKGGMGGGGGFENLRVDGRCSVTIGLEKLRVQGLGFILGLFREGAFMGGTAGACGTLRKLREPSRVVGRFRDLGLHTPLPVRTL